MLGKLPLAMVIGIEVSSRPQLTDTLNDTRFVLKLGKLGIR